MRTPARKGRDPENDPEMESPIERRSRRERWLPTVAIVGRPNVGKSTLFNRLVGRRAALVHDKPGVTRDRRMGDAHWGRTEFLCVDTGGLDLEIEDPLIERVRDQALLGVEQADVIIFLTAVGEEDNPAEHEILEVLRRSGKPIVLTVNKSDNRKLENEAQAFYSYGIGELFPVSALHGGGVPDMLDAVCVALDELEPPSEPVVSGGIGIAVVGRQNVGKSSLVNRLLGEQRMIASDLPGTTRDSIDTTFETKGGELYTLIDTAGIRRRGKVGRGVERLSVLSSMLGMRRADVAVLLVDGSEGITAQDAHIASYCLEEGLSTIVVVNKWDIVEKDEKTADKFTKTLEREWAFLSYAPVVYVSALTGQRTNRICDLAKRVYLNAERRITTPRLNRLLQDWVRRKPPPTHSNRRPQIKYMTQTGVHPPTFTVFVNNPDLIHFSYKRYIVNRLREIEDFEGTPIRLFIKTKATRSREKKPVEEIRVD